MNTIEPFRFEASLLERYEKGRLVGSERTPRLVVIRKNTNGCPGYRIRPGDGYIVSLYIADGTPQMSDKPMRVIRKEADRIELRGYPLDCMMPHGWQEFDYSEYGMTVFYHAGRVSHCVLHLHDRGVNLVYR